MEQKILVSVETNYIKVAILKTLVEMGLEFTEANSTSDVQLKLELFPEKILFIVQEITKKNSLSQFSMVRGIKNSSKYGSVPVLCLLPDDTVDFVAPSMEAKVDEVLLIPKNSNEFKSKFVMKLMETLKYNENEDESPKLNISDVSSPEQIYNELKRASRGMYSIALVLIALISHTPEDIETFTKALKEGFRDTDQVIRVDYRTFMVVCPFTDKENVLDVENKIRKIYIKAVGQQNSVKRIALFGLSYPKDGLDFNELYLKLKKGVQESFVISHIKEPLNRLSKDKLDEYRKRLKL